MGGKILAFAGFDDAAAQQTDGAFAFFSDLATATVGASPADPFIYGRG
jgi:hypothetical protein